MTLIISSQTDDFTLITSDGRCTATTDGKFSVWTDTKQKIFPWPDAPIAVLHTGRDVLCNHKIEDLLRDFMATVNGSLLPLDHIAKKLCDWIEPLIFCEYDRDRYAPFGCNSVVIGFGKGQRGPLFISNDWLEEKGKPVLQPPGRYNMTTTLCTGDGQNQVPPRRTADIQGKSVMEVRSHHNRLMQAAFDYPIAYNHVGGHIHELLISRKDRHWTWLQPPVPSI